MTPIAAAPAGSVVLAAIVGAAAPQPTDPSQLIEPNESLALTSALGLPEVLDFDVSADGRRVVIAAAMGRGSRLFLAAPGATPAPLTEGRRWDTAPRFIGDGLAVVFVSGRRPRGTDPESGRLFRVEPGGVPTPLTDPDLLVRSPRVAPDGGQIAFLARTREAAGQNTGYDLWLLPAAPGGEARRWSRHPGDEGPPVWSPDNSRIAFTIEDPASGSRGLAVVETRGEAPPPEVILVEPAEGPVHGEPDWAPAGRRLLYAARYRESGCPECAAGGFRAIHVADADIPGSSYALIAEARDLEQPRFRPVPGEDGALGVAWVEVDRGSRRIHRSTVGPGADGRLELTGRRRVVTRGAGVHEGLRWTRDGDRLVALHEAAAFPRDVWSFGMTGGRERITDTLFPEIDVRRFSRPEILEVTSRDGLLATAFLYRPAGSDSGEPPPPAPLIVHRRGPAGGAWRNGFDPIVQLLVAGGYAVLVPGVRGAEDQGAAFAGLNDADWGGGDLMDLVAATELAQTLPGVSPDEACVFGVGYGGFLALAALARHPELFRCGIEAMAATDFFRLHRELDPKRRRALARELGPLRGNLERYRSLSLIAEAGRIRAPLLSFHGEDVPEAPLAAKRRFLDALEERSNYPLVALYFREDSGRSVFRPATDRGAAWAWLAKVMEFLSVHLPPP